MFKTSAIVFLLLLASFFLRLYHIDFDGLTSDETLTLCRVNGIPAVMNDQFHITEDFPEYYTQEWIKDRKKWDNVVEATISDSGNAVGYNLMLFQWTKIFGNTNTALRMMSLLFGVLTVILGYYFCRQLFNERTANIAGALLCLHPVLIEYGQMARSYVPAAFFILLTTYSLYQVSVAKKHTWLHIPLYIIALNLSLWSHYATLYVFVSHIFLVAFFHSHRKALIQYAIMAVVGLGIFSIWLFNGGLEGKKLINIEKSMWHSGVSINGEDAGVVRNFADTSYQIVMNFIRIFGNEFPTSSEKNNLNFFILLIPLSIILFVFLKVRKSEYFRPVMFVTFPLAMYLVYLLIMVLRTGHSIPFDIRYSTFIIPFACFLLAFGVDRMFHLYKQPIFGYVFLGIVGIAMVVGFVNDAIHRDKGMQEVDPFTYHNAAIFIEQNISTNDILVFRKKEDAVLTNIYMERNNATVQRIDPNASDDVVIEHSGTKEIVHHFPSH